MALRPLFALTLVLLAALAGCSDAPPAGDLVAIPGLPAAEGTSLNEYRAAVYPIMDAQGNPVCLQNQLPVTPEGQRCVDPFTNFTIHFMSLPEPDGNGYAIYLVGGTIGEKQLAPLVSQEGGMWGLTYQDDEDLSTQFERLELRMGTFVVASAPAAAGSQAFTAAPGLSSVTVAGSYKGRTLTLDVAGLPEDGNYVGRLYTKDEASGALTAAESFPIVAGVQEFKAQTGNIGDFAEFHIHVGSSKVYVYQATL